MGYGEQVPIGHIEYFEYDVISKKVHHVEENVDFDVIVGIPFFIRR